MMPGRSYTSVPELAQRLGVSQHTVLGWISRGELQAINVARRSGGRPSWRISPQAIDQFEAARTATPRPVAIRKRRRADPAITEFY